MRIAVGFDRRAARLGETVIGELTVRGHDVVDPGVSASRNGGARDQSTVEIADLIRTGRVERGILVSPTALQISFLANKIDGIHAGVCADTYDARRSGENGVNLMCLGAGLSLTESCEIVRAFVEAKPRIDDRAGVVVAA